MSAITTYPTLTIDEVKDAVKTIGITNTIMVLSEPGCGKTSILRDLEAEMPNADEYDFIYVDGPNKEIMDIAASIPDHSTKTLEYYVSALFKMRNGKKKVIMIDEALKGLSCSQHLTT